MKRMKAVVFWAGAFALSTWAAASASGVSTAAGAQKGSAAQLERGREVYADRCARCHGSDGRGRTRMGETVEPPDLSDPAWLRGRGSARMIAAVTNGRGQMPAFRKKLSRQDIAASVAYVRTLGR